MGYNIGPTIAVKGDKEYSSALKGIKDSMKLVASEAAVLTAEFGKNSTSVAALKAKSDLLNKSMTEQQKAVSEAEKALQGREGGFMQQARQMPALGGLARKALKGRVQMQIGRVDVADGVHAQSLACG